MKITVFALILLSCVTTVAQQARPEPKTSPTGTTHPLPKEVKTRLFQVKHRDSAKLASVLRGLGSQYAQVLAQSDLKTITVRDLPEYIVVMEEALSRLDVPEPPQSNFEVHLHLLATTREKTATTPLPETLEPVVRQLEKTFRYGGYNYITTLVSRVRESGNIESAGTLEPLPGRQGETRYRLGIRDVAAPAATIQIRNFELILTPQGAPNVQIATELSLRDGSSRGCKPCRQCRHSCNHC